MSDIKKPSQTTPPEHGFDAEFDAFLREQDSRLAALYRKLPHPEPDAAIDAQVRAQARSALRMPNEAAAQASRPVARSRAQRWLPMFGAAATLLLVAGLAWRLVPPTTPPRRETAAIADTPAPGVAQSERTVPMPAPTVPPPAQPATPPVPVDATAQYRHTPNTVAAKPESSIAADNAKTDAKSNAGGALAAAPKIAAPASATPPGSAEPTAFPSRAVEQPRAKSAPPPVAATAPSPPPAAMEAETARSAARAAAAPAPELRESASADGAAAMQAFADKATAGGSSFVVRPEPSAPGRYHWEIGGGPTAAPARDGIYPPDPPPLAAWVEIVRAMLRDGHREAARQALADLRAQHPDFRLPPDLRSRE